VDENTARLLYPLAQMLAGGLAWTYGARHREHRLVGALFSWQLAVDVGRMAVAPVLDAESWPYSGGTLGLYYLDHALELSVRFTILAAVWVHFGRWSVGPVVSAFVVSVAALVTYKSLSGESLIPVHQLFAALGATGCVGIILLRVFGPREGAPRPDGAHAVLLVLVATDAANSIAHATHLFDVWWAELRTADTVAVFAVVGGYSIALGKEAIGRWRQA